MKISLNELKKYVDIEGISPLDIANKLTFAGIEVENISQFASGTNLVIGHVLSCEKHPDSDHLHVCNVDVGDEVLQIVCGAPNVAKDAKVIVAKVGAILPNVEIKKGVIRGVESNGMLCSLLELGVDRKYLSDSQINGIELLPQDAPIGDKEVLKYLGLDDTILNLKPLANRSDANSIYCVAYEVGTLFNKKVTIPNVNISKLKESNVDFKVDILTPRCFKFVSRVVKGIKVMESPLWLKNVLNSSGVRSINNIVDIGNYVMLLTGQPLHMYDYDKLNSKELVVRDDLQADFVALDSQTYKVLPDDITITSNGEIECLGGVMGSLHSETTSSTHTLVIEAAIFESKAVRLTSNRLGLVSESSSRFVKGINKFNQLEAINLAISFLNNIGGVESISKVYEKDSVTFTPTVIECTYSYINKRLGTSFSNEVIKNTLESLHFEIKEKDTDTFLAYAPLYRIDILDKADLSEEVIRILGFDNIEASFPTMKITVGKLSESKQKENLVSNYLVNNGFFDVVTYTLVNKKQIDELNLFKETETLKTINPLTDDHEYIRYNMLPSMLNVVSYNVKRKQNNFKLFEISNVYSKDYESKHLVMGLYGSELYQGQLIKHPFNFYSVKGYFENIMLMFGIEPSRYNLVRVESNNTYFNPGKSCYIYLGKSLIGVMGELHPYTLKNYDLKDTLAVLELDLNAIFALKAKAIKASEISKFPPVERDLAFFINKDVEANKIISCIKKSASNYAPNVSIFDIYHGENIDSSLKSIAVNIVLNPLLSTLKDEEISAIMDKIILDLATSFGAKLR